MNKQLEWIKDNREAIIEALPEKFTYTHMSKYMVGCRLNLTVNFYKIKIVTYYPRWRYSKAVGYVTKSEPYVIHVNGYRNTQGADLVQLFAHEISHIIGFGHGGNAIHWWNKKKKMASVPYTMGRVAKELYTDKNINNRA